MEEEKEQLKQKPLMRYIVPFSFSDGYEKCISNAGFEQPAHGGGL